MVLVFPLRQKIFAALLALTLIFLAVISSWFYAGMRTASIVDEWIAAGRADGYDISYGSRELFGFPHNVVLRLGDVKWRNANGIVFHADDMDIAANLRHREKFRASFKGHVEASAPLDEEHTLRLAGGSGIARVTLRPDGVWRKADLELSGAEVGLAPEYLFHIGTLKASAERPVTPPIDQHEAGLQLSGEANDVDIPSMMPASFGPHMKKLSVGMRVMGSIPDIRRRESVEAWNKSNGNVTFDSLALDWGQLQVSARGTLGFDDDLQPEGVFSSIIHNPQQTFKTLIDSNVIPQRQAEIMKSAMDILGRPQNKSDPEGLELPISVQLGGVFLGPIRMFAFSMIDWPVSPVIPAKPAN